MMNGFLKFLKIKNMLNNKIIKNFNKEMTKIDIKVKPTEREKYLLSKYNVTLYVPEDTKEIENKMTKVLSEILIKKFNK